MVKPSPPVASTSVLDAVDAGGGRSAGEPGPEALDRVGVALGLELDRPVVRVAHPADECAPLGLGDRREPEADPLHATAHDRVDPHAPSTPSAISATTAPAPTTASTHHTQRVTAPPIERARTMR